MMKDQISILAELSRADQESARVRERAAAIPKEIARHEQELSAHRRAAEDYETKLEESTRERRALERDADQARARRREVEVQQFRVKNQVEYLALTKEIEEMRRRTSTFEDQAIEILTAEEDVKRQFDKLKELLEQEEVRFAEIRTRLEGELAGIRAEVQKAETERIEFVGRLDPKIRSRYERILRNKGDMAVVPVIAGACGGCFYQLPPQKIGEVKKRASLVVCEGCGRMVVATQD
jgi:predicted  nucleic acid-binding Zn-ribbon protein